MNKYIISVLTGGAFWGLMGLFTRHLSEYGIGPGGAIIVRCLTGAVCFGILIFCTDTNQFKVKLKDWWTFLGSGLLSLLFFTFCYFNAINIMSLSEAAILLYTAPTIVMLLSAVLFKEKLTKIKIISAILAFAGCSLVCGIAGGVNISVMGLLFGLGSGFGYALYTIFSRYALDRGYSSSTINFYSCLLASAGAMLIWGDFDIVKCAASSAASLGWCLGVGVISCFVPYMLYTYGLTGLENGKASVLASIEPVVASLVGIVIYHERISLPSLIGIVLVLAAIVLLGRDEKK